MDLFSLVDYDPMAGSSESSYSFQSNRIFQVLENFWDFFHRFNLAPAGGLKYSVAHLGRLKHRYCRQFFGYLTSHL